MAWENTLQDASFRGVPFDCLTTRDHKDKALAAYEYLYRNGGSADDLGWRPRRITVAAVLYGADYEARLAAFMEALDKPGPGELIHPVFGVIPLAQVVSYEASHRAEAPNSCELAIEFLEVGEPAKFFAEATPRQQAEAVSLDVADARGSSLTGFREGVRALQQRIQSAKDVLAVTDQFNGIAAELREGVTGLILSGLDVLTFPQSWVSDVRATLDAIVDVPLAMADRLQSSFGGLLPVRDALFPRRTGGSASPTVSSFATPVPAAGTPAASARTLAEDLVLRERALHLAAAAADLLGREADAPQLTPADIERLANTARAPLQEAVASARSALPLEQHFPIVESLKRVAWGVQEAAMRVLVARPPLVRREAPADCNLHLLAHWWYADHARADELRRLNPQIRNPNFVLRGTPVYGYAR